ncbi:hypothetical protein [Nesterenkonia alba]|uniref:hypothetical protein n=1 Tax=Nesterenkonia alba TaxID=515814 RepID=UPI0003B499C3|nr:hypothetical protein [Nesterenkonia alba]
MPHVFEKHTLDKLTVDQLKQTHQTLVDEMHILLFDQKQAFLAGDTRAINSTQKQLLFLRVGLAEVGFELEKRTR